MKRIPNPFLLCYVDHDGVLMDDAVYWSPQDGIHIQTPGRKLFEWVPILDELLAPYPEVKIVLSATWVRMKGFEFAKSRLTPGLQEKLTGATFDNLETQKLDFNSMSRGMQICADVERGTPVRWFGIDNDG